MLKLCREIFDPERKKLFEKLSAFKKHGFLAGGTALALQLGHRQSFDFDIFLPKLISAKFLKKAKEILGQDIKIRFKKGDLLLIATPENIEVHFVYYWYKNLYPLIETDSISLSSIADIAADKAFTIGQRGEWRDYVDIFSLLKKGIFSFEKIMKLAQEKYGGEFNPRLFLEQLSYFQDITEFRISFMDQAYSVKEIQTFLIKTVKNFDIKTTNLI